MKKNIVKLHSLLLSAKNNFPEFKIFLKYIRNETILTNDEHIILTSEWLLKAQYAGEDFGYSRGFYLYKKEGWDKSYIETTGYIIPTMLQVYQHTGDKRYLNSVLKAGKWLLDNQNKNGSFNDIDNDIELVFDTGQVLYGLIALYEYGGLNDMEQKRYCKAIDKAAAWLCNVQDDDGSWTRYGYQQIGHTYYSRVAAILYKAGLICKSQQYKNASAKHIKWVLKNQKENGFFNKLEFISGERPLLHAIIYVLEGLYDYYLYTNDSKVFDALLKNAKKLKEINIQRDLLLCSQYNDSFECVNSERCMTGLAQWANLAFKLYRETDDEDFLVCAKKSLYYLKGKQFKEGENLKGSLPGSVPFWGYYAPFRAVNWGVKFFIDAMLEYREFESDLVSQSNEWISECFRMNTHVVKEEFSQTGKEYIKYLETYIKEADTVLDLGCGEGKYIRYFQKRFADKRFFGIDPVFGDGDMIQKGDIYHFSCAPKPDLIYAIEVLQHVKYPDQALSNVRNQLADKGCFIICDREPKSLLGFLKPLYEYRDKWMYPFDSPFIEKWYSVAEWDNLMEKNGFIIEKVIPVTSSTGKIPWMNRFNILICKKR